MESTWSKVKSNDPLLFEKELLPVGKIVPYVNAKHEVAPVEVEKSFLQNIVNHFKKFTKVGVRVPVFKSHTEDADNDRGTIQNVFIKKNSKGIDSLFGLIKFHDVNAAKRGTKVDVSVMVPPRFRDGKGNVYLNALRHVALTSLPVVPGLEDWQGTPMICSFDSSSGLMLSADTMTAAATDGSTKPPSPDTNSGGAMSELIDQILEAMGLTVPEGSDDMAKLRAIMHDASGGGDAPAGGAPPAGDLNLAFPPMLFNTVKKARETEIDGLVLESVLTPARAVEWKKKYCADEALRTDLRLSSESSEVVETEFDRMATEARLLAKDRPMQTSGRTLLKLAHGEDNSKDNPLVAEAKRRAEAAAKRA